MEATELENQSAAEVITIDSDNEEKESVSDTEEGEVLTSDGELSSTTSVSSAAEEPG